MSGSKNETVIEWTGTDEEFLEFKRQNEADEAFDAMRDEYFRTHVPGDRPLDQQPHKPTLH
jgi:hypothetical protein